MKIIFNAREQEKKIAFSKGIILIIFSILAYNIPIPFVIWLMFIMFAMAMLEIEIEIKK